MENVCIEGKERQNIEPNCVVQNKLKSIQTEIVVNSEKMPIEF